MDAPGSAYRTRSLCPKYTIYRKEEEDASMMCNWVNAPNIARAPPDEDQYERKHAYKKDRYEV
jgi:hypothetical protein